MSTPLPDTAPKTRFDFVFVLGVPHCGSTLLGMMLNSHPDICSVGEMALTGQAIASNRPCSCGQPIASCPFWKPLLPILKPRSKSDYRRYTPDVYRRLRTELGSRILVDLSKSLAWRMTRGTLSPWKRSKTGFIFLVRDSRAVVSSRPPPDGQGLQEVLRQHKKWMLRLSRYVERKRQTSITVHYEDICTNPQQEMMRICEWLGVPYHDSMLDPYKPEVEHHLVHSSSTPYTRQTRTLKLDERWRTRIDTETQAKIEAVMRQIPIQAKRYLGDAPKSSKSRQG